VGSGVRLFSIFEEITCAVCGLSGGCFSGGGGVRDGGIDREGWDSVALGWYPAVDTHSGMFRSLGNALLPSYQNVVCRH